MTNDDKVCSDFFCEFCNFLPCISSFQPGGGRKAQRLKTLHAFRKDGFVIFRLLVEWDRKPSMGGNDRSSLHNGQQKSLGSAELRELGSLPQRAPSFD